MAIMIPPEISADADRFEQQLFDKFKKVPAKWKIFHQFYVNAGGPRPSPRPRELDFVILIPGPNSPASYSVIYLEAKGGRYSIKDRQWFRAGQPIDRSPPEQARTGMFVLQNKFTAQHPQYKENESLYISFLHAVAFADWDVSDEAARQDDVAKGALLLGSRDVQNGARIIQLLSEHANNARRNRFDKIENWNQQKHQFAAAQMRDLEAMLNPPAETRVTAFHRHNLDTLLPELLEPTNSQTTALSLIESNARCVIDGAAGTGKTVLAMESVRQRCENHGETVALLCSNPVLSSRFEKWADTLSPQQGGRALTGTPASLLTRAFAANPAFLSRHQQRLDNAPNLEKTLKQGDLDNGWRDFVEKTLRDLESETAVFDYLVIDEAQNLCDDVFLRLLDKLLKGGLAHGRWTMFGDFINQNIVTPRRENSQDVKAALETFGAYYTNYRLDTNCRNTYEIAQAAYNITDIASPTLPGLHGPEVEFRYFDSSDRVHELLEKQLADWQSYGFESRQIIMLSGGNDNPFDPNRQYGNWKLVNIADAPSGSDIRVSDDNSPHVRYSDIFDFQGLESDLVILVLPMEPSQTKVDGVITLPHHNYLNRLLYIAMSRANAMLIVMADEGYKMHLEPDAWV